MVPIVPGRRRGWVRDFARTGGAHRWWIWTVVRWTAVVAVRLPQLSRPIISSHRPARDSLAR